MEQDLTPRKAPTGGKEGKGRVDRVVLEALNHEEL